jgi:hypothetical protein
MADLRPVLEWARRHKTVLPMLDGYDGYLHSTGVACELVEC